MEYENYVKNTNLGQTCGMYRVTVFPKDELTEEGEALRRKCSEDARKPEKVKKEFQMGRLILQKSGSRTMPGGAFLLNSWENRAFLGVDAEGHTTQTSVIVLYDINEKWLLTKSGSLYKFKEIHSE